MGQPHEGVVWFAKEMEKKLEENSHKRGWDDIDVDYGLMRLKQEVDELDPIINYWIYDEASARAVIGECADIANFAMMLAYTVRGWRTSKPEGS